jgi:cobalt-zinc-cadmium efflux system protein
VAVNIAASWAIRRANRTSLNVEGAFQHILNDLYAFAATVVAGLVMVFTGFDRADAIASLVVVALMARAGLRLLRDSGRILLEAAPVGLDPDVIGEVLAGVDGVCEVHDLHVWTISSGRPALSAHVLVLPERDCHRIRSGLNELLGSRFGIGHTTLQVDHSGEDPTASNHDHCQDAHGPTHSGLAGLVG